MACWYACAVMEFLFSLFLIIWIDDIRITQNKKQNTKTQKRETFPVELAKFTLQHPLPPPPPPHTHTHTHARNSVLRLESPVHGLGLFQKTEIPLVGHFREPRSLDLLATV